MHEILGELQTDESGPHHDHPATGLRHGGVDQPLDPIDVVEISQCEHPR